MIIAAAIVSALLALLLLISGVMKIRLAPAVVASLTPLGVPRRAIPGLGSLEIAATLGLLAGLVWWPLGAAAASGAILYFAGAIVTHVRVRDNAIAPAAVLLLASVVALALIVAAR